MATKLVEFKAEARSGQNAIIRVPRGHRLVSIHCKTGSRSQLRVTGKAGRTLFVLSIDQVLDKTLDTRQLVRQAKLSGHTYKHIRLVAERKVTPE